MRQLIKSIGVIMLVFSLSSHGYSQKVTEASKEAAYSAPLSKLAGTWTYEGVTFTFNKNGTATTQLPLPQGASLYNIPISAVVNYTVTKKGNSVTMRPVAGNNWLVVGPESGYESAYRKLSPRQKSEFDKACLAGKNNVSRNQLNQNLTLNYVSNDYLVFGDQVWENVKHISVREAEEKAYREEKARKEAEEAELKKKQEVAELMPFLPESYWAKINNNSNDAVEVLRSIRSLTIPEQCKEIPEVFGKYFTSLDTLQIPGNLKEIPKLANPLKVLYINSFNTSFPKGTTSALNVKGAWLYNIEGYSSDQVIIKAECKDEGSVLQAIGEGGSRHNYILVLKPFNGKVLGFPNLSGEGKRFINIQNQLKENLCGVFIQPTDEEYIIQNNSFKDCRNLQKVELSPNLSLIGYSAFENCPMLYNINFMEGLKKFTQKSFKNTGLTNLAIPESVFELIDQCFAECENLLFVSLQGKYTEIKKNYFLYDAKLHGVVVGPQITKIEKESFLAAKTVYFQGSIPPKVDKAFSPTAIAYVPAANLDAYTKAFKKNFAQILGVSSDEEGYNKVIEVVKAASN